MLNRITVRATGVVQLDRFAKDLERVLAKIDGKKFTVFVEPEFSQVPRNLSLADAMKFAGDLLREHHRTIGLRPGIDGVGPNERQFVQKFVAEHAGISRPSNSGSAGSLRKQAQLAIGQAQSILPGNRVLMATIAALKGKKSFSL